MATRTVRTFVDELWNGGTSKRAEKSESEANRGDKIQDSATTLSTTTRTAALYRYSSWCDDDSDDDEALGALSDATILKRMGSFSSVHSLDTVDLSESDESTESTVKFSMESTRIIEYEPPSREYHDDLFYQETELESFRENQLEERKRQALILWRRTYQHLQGIRDPATRN